MSEICSHEYWVRKGDVDLYLFRKRRQAPRARSGEPLPVLFLVHGSSFCGRSGFDMQVAGHDDYSLMDAFADRGFDVWTMDHEGYGRSTRTDGNSDIANSVDDLEAGAAVVERETGLSRLAFYGQSSGALRAAAFAAAFPDRATHLVLDAFVWTGEDAPTLIKRVASKGGTTEAGMQVLEREGKTPQALVAAVQAACRRSEELSRKT